MFGVNISDIKYDNYTIIKMYNTLYCVCISKINNCIINIILYLCSYPNLVI